MLLFRFGLVDGEIGEWEWDYFWWGPLGSVFESLVLLTMIVACSKNHVATTLTWGDNESGKFDLDLVLGVLYFYEDVLIMISDTLKRQREREF